MKIIKAIITTVDFKPPNNTHNLKSNTKESSLMAMSSELNGVHNLMTININSIYLMAINNLHRFNGH